MTHVNLGPFILQKHRTAKLRVHVYQASIYKALKCTKACVPKCTLMYQMNIKNNQTPSPCRANGVFLLP